jgi:transposase
MFMSRGYQELNVDGKEVFAKMQKAENLEEYKRYQAIHLRVNEKMDVESIVRVTGLARSTVSNLHSLCRRNGIESIVLKKKGGRYNSCFSLEEEKQLLATLEPADKSGGIVEVSKIRKAMEEKLGRTVPSVTAYRLLHRHGWRKIAPRPKHPNDDPVAQANFKKTDLESLRRLNKKPLL